jgi:hypothetical protein
LTAKQSAVEGPDQGSAQTVRFVTAQAASFCNDQFRAWRGTILHQVGLSDRAETHYFFEDALAIDVAVNCAAAEGK